MGRKVFLFCLIFSFFAGLVHGADNGLNPLRGIEEALSKGELSFAEAVNLKVMAIFAPEKLPPKFRPRGHIKSATFTLLEALKNPEMLTQENRFVLHRPTDPEDEDYYGSGVSVLTYDSPSGHFKIHYTEDDTHGDAVAGSDGDPDTIPWFVSEVAQRLDEVWSWMEEHGYPLPPPDGTNGGDGKFDVYLLNLEWAYGYTAYDEDGYLYIVMENDFAGFPLNLDPAGQQIGDIKVTAAHEFFHVVQWQFKPWQEEDIWWLENTAVWVEDEIYDEVNDYLHYVGYRYDDSNGNGRWDPGETWYQLDGTPGSGPRPSRWMDHPELPLDTFNGWYEYGGVIWAKFLSESLGTEVIRDIMEALAGGDAWQAIEEGLGMHGVELEEVLPIFRLKNLWRDYREGSFYPPPRFKATVTSYPASVGSSFFPPYAMGLEYTSCEYIAFEVPPGVDALSFELEFSPGHAELEVLVLFISANGTYRAEELPLDYSAGDGVLDLMDASLYQTVIFMLTNTAVDSGGISYSIQAEGLYQGLSELLFPHIASGEQWWTAFVLLNVGDDAEVAFFLYDKDGHEIASCTRQLRSFQKKVFFLRSLFPEVTLPEDGWVKATTANGTHFLGFEAWGTYDLRAVTSLQAIEKSE